MHVINSSFFIPTQDTKPSFGLRPSGFIIFGQQKTCTPIRIFLFAFKHHIGCGQLRPKDGFVSCVGKTQILIEFLDGTKKVQLFGKKSSASV